MTSDETVARPAFASRADSLFSSRIWANSPASSQYPPQFGHSSTSTLRLALKKWRLSLTPAQRGHSRLRATSTCTRSSRRIFSKWAPAASALANIDHQATDLSLGQFVETRWAFHTFQFCIEIALNCNVDFDPLRPKTSLVFHTLDPQVLISTGA